MHRVDPVQLCINKGSEEHLVVVFRYDVFTVDKISQRGHRLPFVLFQVSRLYIFSWIVVYQFKGIGKRKSEDFNLIVQVIEPDIRKFRQNEFDRRFLKKCGTVMQLRLVSLLQEIGFPEQLLFTFSGEPEGADANEGIELFDPDIRAFNKILQVQVAAINASFFQNLFYKLILQPFDMDKSHIDPASLYIRVLIGVIDTGRLDITTGFQ